MFTSTSGGSSVPPTCFLHVHFRFPISLCYFSFCLFIPPVAYPNHAQLPAAPPRPHVTLWSCMHTSIVAWHPHTLQIQYTLRRVLTIEAC